MGVPKLHGFHTLRLMRVFVTHRNQVLTHHEFLQAVWGCLRLFVNQLRKKIEPNTQPPACRDRYL
jgi:DNA-binding response OmpR family regulator